MYSLSLCPLKFPHIDVIVVVLESEELLISNTIKGYFKSKLQIDIIPIPDDVVMGTADSLRYIKEKIKVKCFYPLKVFAEQN